MANKIIGFLKEAKAELKKVTWTTRDELISSTIMVLTVTAMLAVFIGSCDFVLSRLVAFLIGR